MTAVALNGVEIDDGQVIDAVEPRDNLERHGQDLRNEVVGVCGTVADQTVSAGVVGPAKDTKPTLVIIKLGYATDDVAGCRVEQAIGDDIAEGVGRHEVGNLEVHVR